MADLRVQSEMEKQQQLMRTSLWMQLQRFSRDLIYSVLMRSGGEPFGAPFEAGVPSLTERIVQRYKQRGFFGFETLERLRRRAQRNKYTRHGAAPFRGPYQQLPPATVGRGFVDRLVDYLRENRFFLFASVQREPPPPARPAAPRARRRTRR